MSLSLFLTAVGASCVGAAGAGESGGLPSIDGCVGVDPTSTSRAVALLSGLGQKRHTGTGTGTGSTSGEASGTGEGSETGDGDGDSGSESGCGTCIGEPWPQWQLTDVQPRSCGHEQSYGLDVFKGHVTFVALLAGW